MTPGVAGAANPGTMWAVSGSAWGIVWLAVALKVPIIALLYLVWWAIKDPPEQVIDDDGGSPDRDPLHPRDRPPYPPRRGPHGPPEPAAPARVRVAQRRTPRRILR